jgi:hypothetical protein
VLALSQKMAKTGAGADLRKLMGKSQRCSKLGWLIAALVAVSSITCGAADSQRGCELGSNASSNQRSQCPTTKASDDPSLFQQQHKVRSAIKSDAAIRGHDGFILKGDITNCITTGGQEVDTANAAINCSSLCHGACVGYLTKDLSSACGMIKLAVVTDNSDIVLESCGINSVAGGTYCWLTTTGPGAVNLGTANTYAILSKAGISTVSPSPITGDIGVSPIAATAITGFSLTADSTNAFATSTQVAGQVFAASYGTPTPSELTVTIGDMETAYLYAASRPPPPANSNFLNRNSGIFVHGAELEPGLYKFGSSVTISGDVTIKGNPTDTWIFQMTGNLIVEVGADVILEGGASASNIVWQVAGKVEVGASAKMKGILLVKTSASFLAGSSLTGRILAGTAVTLITTTVTQPLC